MLRSSVGAGALICSLSACETYKPVPLDPAAHHAEWIGRNAEHSSVADFLRALESRGHAPTEFDPADGLSLAEAEIIALVFNSDLRLARLRAGVAAATSEHAGLWDDPVLGLDIERILESVAEPWVIAGAVEVTVPISGRLKAAQSLANAGHAAALYQVALEEWETLARLRLAWLEWSALDLQREITDANLAELDRITSAARQLIEPGEMDRTQVALFELELASRRNEARLVAGRHAEVEAEIRGLLGLSLQAPLEFVPVLNFEPRLASASPEGIHSTLPETNPRLALRRAEYEGAERTLALEIREQYPDLSIGPGYASDEGQPRALLGLSVPLPILNANRQAIAEAHAERELARAAYETEYEQLIIDLQRSLAQLETARAVREDLEANVVPLADRQLDDAERLAELGELDPLVLLESIVRAHDTRLSLIEARLNESLAAVAIDEIIGPATPVPQSPSDITPKEEGQ